MSPGPEGSDDAARPASLTRRYRRYLRVEGIRAGVSIGNSMPPDRLALRRYDEFGVTWPIPEAQTLQHRGFTPWARPIRASLLGFD